MEKGKGNKAKQTEGAEEKKLDGTAYPAQGPGAAGAINFDIIHEASSAPGERREKRGDRGRVGGIARRWRNQQCSHEVLTFFFRSLGPQWSCANFPRFPQNADRSYATKDKQRQRYSLRGKKKNSVLLVSTGPLLPYDASFLSFRLIFAWQRVVFKVEIWKRDSPNDLEFIPWGHCRVSFKAPALLPFPLVG